MSGRKLSDQLKAAVRKMAYQTSVEQLKKRGVNKVNMVSMDRIVSLIEEAVHRGLRHRLIGAEREQVIDATREEFLSLMKSNQELEQSASELRRMQLRAQEEIDVLRRELTTKKQVLEEKLHRASVGDQAKIAGENEAIAKRFRELFASCVEGGVPDLNSLEDGALSLILELVGEERRSAQEARQAAQDSEVDRLQRRIAKLTTNLEESEHRLIQLAALKNVDDGISSIYREVQGLQDNDALYRKKTALMSDIFKANLALQRGD